MADRLVNYQPVQERISQFWAEHELGRIDTELVERDKEHVLAKASVWRVMSDPFPATTGWAEEMHDGSPVNRQGWMIENAETSAIGRALANMGYAPNAARPSAEDMERATARNRRQLADDASADVTFDRLMMIKGTALAQELKDMAAKEGRSLSHPALLDDPEWRAQVDEVLDRDE